MIKEKYPANTPSGINNRDSVTPCRGGPAPSSLALLGCSGQGPGTGCRQKRCYLYYIDLARAKSEALVISTCKQKKLNRVMLNADDNENGFKTNRSN